MSWMLLLGLSIMIFINRYLFLEPRVNVPLPRILKKMLKYSAPCLLTAICVPIVFYEAAELRVMSSNHYLWAAIFCVLLALISQKVISNLVFTLLFFYLINYLIRA
ncbi:AzlD domain-containing protein [Acinetobacter sp. DSM 11652]|uniref:AzlD domain-containing protein n=1 Tax=Acinetobacter sp. DSM 11652 TaxID=346222 RepID=UPI0008C60032|nr:AzlD domain-containing protein [Acinetobacter sp. DSM 11652]SEL23562.1 Branched-chain amino acid transport protein [Acinetobacter sp. DSM 11652]